MSKQAPLSWLRSFEASARYKSFSRAAIELNLTQAAVSKQIKALESQLSCQLFLRHAHGLSLTEQGRRYWLEIKDLIKQLDNITVQFCNQQEAHRLLIRCNISYSVLVLCEHIKIFCQKYPHITIDMMHDVWEPEKPSGNVHLSIGYHPLDSMLKKKVLHEQEERLLSSDVLFPVYAPRLNRKAMATLPLLHVDGYYLDWDWWYEQSNAENYAPIAEALDNYRSNPRRFSWHVDSSLVAYQLAQKGLGIALGRSCLVADSLDNGSLLACDSFVESREGFFIRKPVLGQEHEAADLFYHYLLGVTT